MRDIIFEIYIKELIDKIIDQNHILEEIKKELQVANSRPEHQTTEGYIPSKKEWRNKND